jgi:hypothetical protein
LYVALWCIVEAVAGVKFTSLLSLLSTCLGFDCIKHAYTHARYFWTALYSLSDCLFDCQLERVRASPYYSILVDSSTDVAQEDHLLVFVRYLYDRVDPKSCSCATITEYLCCVQVKATDAEALSNVILGVLEATGLDRSKMVSFCSDGAATFTGVYNGVVVRLREVQSYLLGTHCVAHRTALVMTGNAKSSAILTSIDRLLKAVHSLFAHSSKWQIRWLDFSKLRGVTRFKFPMFNTTRWFSRAQCISVLMANMHALIPFLRANMGWVKAPHALKLFNSKKAVARLHIMHDLMQPMELLSKKFQENAIMPYDVERHVRLCREQLTAMFLTFDDQFGVSGIKGHASAYAEFASKCVDKVWSPTALCSIKFVYDSAEHVLVKEFADLARALIADLDARYSDIGVLSAFKIFSPLSYVGIEQAELAVYGLKDLQELVTNFCKGEHKLFIATKAILSEFAVFKNRMQHYVSMYPSLSTQPYKLFEHIVSECRIDCPQIICFVHCMFVTSVHTSDVERGFSQHKLIKTQLRNRLMLVTLDSLMRVKLLFGSTPLADFPIQSAVLKWFSSKVDGLPRATVAKFLKRVSKIDIYADLSPVQQDEFAPADAELELLFAAQEQGVAEDEEIPLEEVDMEGMPTVEEAVRIVHGFESDDDFFGGLADA